MKLKLILTLLIIAPILNSFSQIETVISDTVRITYAPEINNDDLDSIITINNYHRMFENWRIYFDNSREKLAFESIVFADTCIQTDYWRNGMIKKVDTWVNVDGEFYRWWCDEQYYQNGQLIVRWCPHEFTEETLITRYYPNGNKQMEWTQLNLWAVGKSTWWHDNGIKKSEVNYENKVEEGERKYWDREGNLLKIELWENGYLVE